ncbi:class I SAM-dependent methyltransferase [Pedobacter ghigonis]|uniref:class I SAM-dependent methyltransferase n=1 Tax=Pedobacter ghigonis TaxID=2730403 RepID=UPI001588A9D0|nr:class I SAM-dependent methyltransferase [Pedobacter ghigonis]
MRETNLERLKTTDINVNHIWYLHYKPYHEDLFEAFKLYAKGRLFDIGCGNKPYKNILEQYITDYKGCDIIQSSEELVDIICHANQIPLEDGTFDTIISTQTIEHVEDHQGLVNEAYRLLVKDGHFILSGPMYWPLHEEPYDFFRFTKHGLVYILEKAGFKVVKVFSNGGKWSVVGQSFLHALHPQINSIKGIKGKIIRTLYKSIGGIKTVNRFFLYLDNIYRDDSNTMNYVIVAIK